MIFVFLSYCTCFCTGLYEEEDRRSNYGSVLHGSFLSGTRASFLIVDDGQRKEGT